MKFLKSFALIMLIAVLVGCQRNEIEAHVSDSSETALSISDHTTEDIRAIIDLDTIPYLTKREGAILLIDLVTGEILATHVLENEHAWAVEVFDFDNDYYAALVGVSDMAHLFHRGVIDYDDVEWEAVIWDEQDQQLQFLIFDQELNLLESLFIDSSEYGFDISIGHMEIPVAFENDELLLYFSPTRFSPDPNNPMAVVTDDYSRIQSYNVHTGELITVLDGIDEIIGELVKIDSEHFFFSYIDGLDGGSGNRSAVHSVYGVITPETGVTFTNSRQDFWFILRGSTNSYILLAVYNPKQVLIFNPLTKEADLVRLAEADDILTSQLSPNRQHLVVMSVNEDLLSFRKYEIESGDLIHEIPINPIDRYFVDGHFIMANESLDMEMMDHLTLVTPVIFPITDSIYAIHLYNGLGYQEIHQLVIIP